MAKKEYYVGVREVHVSNRKVVAKSPEEAIRVADTMGSDAEISLDYSHTLDKSLWTVEEVPEKQRTKKDGLIEALETAQDVLGDQLENCESEGCNEDHPCSYCKDSQEAMNLIDRELKKLKK